MEKVDVLVLANKVMKKFSFRSVEYFGPSKNYVFQCVNDAGKKYVFKMFHIHEDRREEDLKKAWREIAFHHYSGAKLRLPAMLACEYSSGELGVYLLTEYKSMRSLCVKDLTEKLAQDVVEKLFWLHDVRISSLNPGLRARIEEEDLRKNDWIVAEADALFASSTLRPEAVKKVKELCKKAKDNALVSKAKKVLTHGDARIQNFYVDENAKLQMRDFEHANINSPLLDAASFYYSVAESPFKDAFKAKFKERLKSELPFAEKEFEEAFTYFILHRLMAWLKFNTTFSKDVGEKTAKKRVQDGVRLLEKFLEVPGAPA